MFRINELIHHQACLQDKQQGNSMTYRHKYVDDVFIARSHERAYVDIEGLILINLN